MKLPRAILFDLDDTIISAYRRPDIAWNKVTAEFAAALTPHEPADIAAAIVAHAQAFWSDRGQHKRWRMHLFEARRRIVTDVLSQHGGPTHWGEAIADRYTTLRDEEMHLHPGAVATLQAFNARGVRLALVTNGDGVGQRKKIERFNLAPHFAHIQIEGEHGFGKPEERSYRHALETLNVAPAETWMVGDNLEWEVAAPQRLGIHAIWFDGEGEGLPGDATAKPDRIIKALPELLSR
jgi:putative hydrolase of the HAD superfamily